MRRRKKQLLGALGLASVIAMTGIACALPAADASAESGSLDISVTVEASPGGGGGGGGSSSGGEEEGGDPGVAMLSLEFDADGLQDGDMIRNQIFSISTKYSHVSSIAYALSCSNSAGDTKNYSENSGPLTGTSGTHTATFDLTALSGPYVCRLTATGTNTDGTTISDTINLTYRALSVEVTTEVDSVGDPLVTITTRDDVAYFLLYVYHRDTRLPVFVNADGEEEPIKVTADMFASNASRSSIVTANAKSAKSRFRLATASTSSGYARLASEDGVSTTSIRETGVYRLYLPMARYNAPTGEYYLVAIAYDRDGNVISINEDPFTYVVPTDTETPGVPGTGSIFKDLNISHADFLIAGLIAFGLAIFIAIRFFAKKHKI